MLQKLDAKVGVFEREMFARAGRVTKLTDDLTKTYFFTPGGAQPIVPRTSLHACFNTPKILHWFFCDKARYRPPLAHISARSINTSLQSASY